MPTSMTCKFSKSGLAAIIAAHGNYGRTKMATRRTHLEIEGQAQGISLA